VGLACSLSGLSRPQVFRLGLSLRIFQFLMPVIGWFIGENLLKLVSNYDHWVAFGLLLLVGLRMVWQSFKMGMKSIKVPTLPGAGRFWS